MCQAVVQITKILADTVKIKIAFSTEKEFYIIAKKDSHVSTQFNVVNVVKLVWAKCCADTVEVMIFFSYPREAWENFKE